MFLVRQPRAFDEIPELGMGFQFGIDDEGRGCIVVNGEIALTVEDVARQEISVIVRNVVKDFRLSPAEVLNIGILAQIGVPYRSVKPFDDVGYFLKFFGHLVSNAEAIASRTVLHASPPFPLLSRVGEQFVRFSAFLNDRRVQADGGLLPGSYVTSRLDAGFAPSGFAVVGRYALPNPVAAVHRFEIAVSAAVPGLVGTVAPAFLQAGGGVEIELTSGTQPGSVTNHVTIPEH